MVWVNEKARKVWEPVIRDCSQMVQDLEIESVLHDHRKCAWRTIPLKQLPGFTKKCNNRGLIVTPVNLVANWGNGFAHKTQSPKPDDPNPNCYCIVSKYLCDAIEFRDAHTEGDHIKQGEMLGFPDCCTEFFNKNWKEDYFDPMWQSAINTLEIMGCGEVSGNEIDLYNLTIANKIEFHAIPLLRYIGLRVGFHIPCSFNCQETIMIGKERLFIIQDATCDVYIPERENDRQLIKLLEALLSMPMEWSVLHGIVIVKTPIFYLITSGHPTIEKYTIKIEGEFIPRESAKGVNFPFNLEVMK